MGSMPPILRYTLKSHHNEGKLPFSECTSSSIKIKATKDDGASTTSLKEGVTVSTLKMWQAKVSRPSILGFVVSSKAGDDLPSVRTKEGFDPNVYRLMERAGYDFQNPATLGKLVEGKPYGHTETQGKIQEQAGSVGVSKVGLGCTPPQPVKILGRRTAKKLVI